MSQLASGPMPIIVGNNVRALSVAVPQTPRTPANRPKTPLSLVVSVPRGKRVPFGIAIFLLILASLSAVLIMSVSVSTGQYELVSLKKQQNTLEQSNQELQLALSARETPQSLVAAAAAMGMVPAATTGQIDIRTQKVSGSPQPASAATKSLAVIPPADVNKPKPVVLTPSASSSAQAPSTAQAASTKIVPEAMGPSLNGGTIPAPAQLER